MSCFSNLRYSARQTRTVELAPPNNGGVATASIQQCHASWVTTDLAHVKALLCFKGKCSLVADSNSCASELFQWLVDFLLLLSSEEVGRSKHLWNFRKLLSDYTTLQHRGQPPSEWKLSTIRKSTVKTTKKKATINETNGGSLSNKGMFDHKTKK